MNIAGHAKTIVRVVIFLANSFVGVFAETNARWINVGTTRDSTFNARRELFVLAVVGNAQTVIMGRGECGLLLGRACGIGLNACALVAR